MRFQAESLEGFAKVHPDRESAVADLVDLAGGGSSPEVPNSFFQAVRLALLEGSYSDRGVCDHLGSSINKFSYLLDSLREHPLVLGDPKNFIFNTFRSDNLSVLDTQAGE